MDEERYLITVTDDGHRRDVVVDRVDSDYPLDYAGTPIGASSDSTRTLPLVHLVREAAAMLTRDFEQR